MDHIKEQAAEISEKYSPKVCLSFHVTSFPLPTRWGRAVPDLGLGHRRIPLRAGMICTGASERVKNNGYGAPVYDEQFRPLCAVHSISPIKTKQVLCVLFAIPDQRATYR